MPPDDTWKLQDAKARFSELVRRARAGEPQRVTVHGKAAVVVADLQRFEVQPKELPARTMADFIERSRKYRLTEDIEFDRPLYMDFPDPQVPGDGGDEE